MIPLYFFILSLSVGIPFFTGLILFRKLNFTERFFVVYLGICLINEILFYILPSSNLRSLDYNIFFLVEFIWIVILLQFMREEGMRLKLINILSIGILVWLLSNLYDSFYSRNPIFQIYSSISIVILSIDLINKLYFESNSFLLKNYRFILCACFILFFTLSLIDVSLAVMQIEMSRAFKLNVYLFRAITNVIVNLIFTIAIIWMKRRKIYS